jgi:hypothetical protein
MLDAGYDFRVSEWPSFDLTGMPRAVVLKADDRTITDWEAVSGCYADSAQNHQTLFNLEARFITSQEGS